MIAVLGALTVVSVLAWAIDSQGRDGVQRNVTLAGQGIGGLSRDQLTAVVGELASRYVTAQVRVEAPGGGFDTDSHSLGLAEQEQATVEAALEVGRSGSVVDRLGSWVASLVRPRRAPVRIGVDHGFVYRVVATRYPGTPRPGPGAHPRGGAREARGG